MVRAAGPCWRAIRWGRTHYFTPRRGLASCSPFHPGGCLVALVYHASSIVPRSPIISVNRWPDPHETFFKAVRRVPPGMRAVLSKGRLQFDRYWDPAPVGRPLQWLTPEEASGFDDVFERAVKRCLCHGQAGIFLSGGLDSISVAAVAADCARASGQSLPLALSLGFPDPECNEQERQAAVARRSRASPAPYRF